ncbi:MAG: hypothetical protein PV354_12555, partial [Bartonella sp.]|nr:hypothetical protein [Bartonella sp.]
MLIQNLHSEKKNLEETAAVARPVSRSKPLDSVVQHLAHMACGENQERFSLQEAPNFSGRNNINPVSPNAINALQQGDKGSLPVESKQPSSKEADGFVESSITEENCSDIQASGCCIKNDQYAPSLKADSLLKREPLGIFSFLRFPVKKLLPYFLTIAFMVAITL